MPRLVAISFLFAAAICAPTNRGGISGTVTDPTGAVVPGATVTVTNIRTIQVRTATSSNTGVFTVADLELVEYRIEVTATGFYQRSRGYIQFGVKLYW